MKLDLTGQRYGRLTVIKEEGSTPNRISWLCKCDCGNYKIVKTINLRRGATKSCGCYRSEYVKNQKQMYPRDVRIRRLRYIWHGMKRRCEDPKHKGYESYGGRGITVCNEWRDYVTFARWAISHGYDDGLTIDRINNDGNYEPNNCRWVTIKEQLRNTRRNHLGTINGTTKTVTECAEEYGLDPNTVLTRMSKGMSLQESLLKKTHRHGGRGIPIRCIDTGEEFQSVTAVSEKYGFNTSCIARAVRLNRMSYGMRWKYVFD